MTPSWVGLQSVIVAFPDHTHLLFAPLTSLFYASFSPVSNKKSGDLIFETGI